MKKMQKLTRNAMKEVKGAAGTGESCTSHSQCPPRHLCIPFGGGTSLSQRICHPLR